MLLWHYMCPLGFLNDSQHDAAGEPSVAKHNVLWSSVSAQFWGKDLRHSPQATPNGCMGDLERKKLPSSLLRGSK
ncbi:hypothetical protein R1flu_009847 [Riccia fluitans]|uniref:Uncharacterized protein n=1 Tax=Riccia fluitans TaxID=41844 RepID=A0ABD1Z424_9MARC